jgi:hypothetical protein
MEILKYLDVLIGLAVVMLLLSPLVTAFTQVCLWLFNARSGRLQVGLTSLILELNGSPYERFDAAEITGLAPNAPVTFAQPAPQPALATHADATGSIVLTQNIPAMLAAHGGDLLPSLTLPAIPPGGAAPVIHLRPRGSGADWQITGPPTGPLGDATLTYRFHGPAQFASNTVTADIPADATLTVTVASGTYKGAQLNLAGNVYTYPAHVAPVPTEHLLALTLTQAGAPLPLKQVTLTFQRNRAYDQPNPLPPPVSLSLGEAEKIAESVLLHPMIAQPTFWRLPWPRKGEVVDREELIRVLLGFAANPTAIGLPAPKPAILEAMRRLRQLLAENDVPDPGRALADIREAAQRLELTDAAAAAHDRFTTAILQSAQSAFVGRVNAWFDHVMDRTTGEYKFRAQLVTILGALVVAFAVQLDTIDLLKRLSSDDKLRDSLVQQAGVQQKRFDEQQKVATPNQNELDLARMRRDEIESNLANLRDPQLKVLPDHFIWQPLPQARLMYNPAWTPPYLSHLELVVGGAVYPLQPQGTADPLADIESAIRNSNAPLKAVRQKLAAHYDLVLTSRLLGPLQLRSTPGKPETNMLNAAAEWSCTGPVCFDRDLFQQSWRGVVLTWVLLSLGAPFWYDALKDLLKLRSTVAKKEEDARNDRQTDTTAAAAAKPAK